jgi:SNF2 family DNA or RNA helicase
VDLQAQDRASHIGQSKAGFILRFITEKSVEEVCFSELITIKLDINDKVMQSFRQ